MLQDYSLHIDPHFIEPSHQISQFNLSMLFSQYYVYCLHITLNKMDFNYNFRKC